MRSTFAVGLAFMITAGCVQVDVASSTGTSVDDVVPVRVVGDNGLEDVPRVPGLVVSPTHLHLEVLDGPNQDRLRILLVELGASQPYEYTEDLLLKRSESSPDPTSESNQANTVCYLDAISFGVDMGFYVDRALDRPTTAPHAPASQSWGWGMGGTEHSSHGTGSGEGRAGSWVMIAMGQSGLDPVAAVDAGSKWTVDVKGPIRQVIDLPPARLACGWGLANLGSGTELPTFPPTHIGGSRSEPMLYGATFHFCSMSTEALIVTNSASVTFLGKTTPLGSTSQESMSSHEQGDTELRVDQWIGSPMWLMAGFELPTLTFLVCF